MSIICYLNGEYLPLAEARISPMDRGFLFGDAVYEVVRIYGGRPFLLARHLERLFKNLSLLEMPNQELECMEGVCHDLLKRNAIGEATLYLQISRGVGAERRHAYTEAPLTVFGYISPYVDKIAPQRQSGCDVITLEDKRSQLVSIKTVNLLPNVLANQAARLKGVAEAVLVSPSGDVMEGTHTNLFGVLEGTLRTAPLSLPILPGITRELVLLIANDLGLIVEEKALSREELFECEEVFLTGTTTEILPVVRIDGHSIATGIAGLLTREVQNAFRGRIEADCQLSREELSFSTESEESLKGQYQERINL